MPHHSCPSASEWLPPLLLIFVIVCTLAAPVQSLQKGGVPRRCSLSSHTKLYICLVLSLTILAPRIGRFVNKSTNYTTLNGISLRPLSPSVVCQKTFQSILPCCQYIASLVLPCFLAPGILCPA